MGSEGEAAFAASIPNEFDHELYVIAWAGGEPYFDEQEEAWVIPGTPSLVRKEQSVIDAERAAQELANFRATADCSRLQAKLALEAAGLLATVDAFIADPDTPNTAKLAWNEAYRYSRSSPLFDTLGPAIGMTPEQIDDLFVAAQQIEV